MYSTVDVEISVNVLYTYMSSHRSVYQTDEFDIPLCSFRFLQQIGDNI